MEKFPERYIPQVKVFLILITNLASLSLPRHTDSPGWCSQSEPTTQHGDYPGSEVTSLCTFIKALRQFYIVTILL